MSSDWTIYPLDSLCLKITDGAHLSPKSVVVGKPMASVKDLTRFGVDLSDARKISIEDFNALVRQGCQPVIGDVLIAKDGNSALDTVCCVDEPLEAVLLSSVAILRPNPILLDSHYLKHYLSSQDVILYLKKNFISGAAIPRVVLRDFKKAEIKLPPLKVQKAIAATLDSLDDRIYLLHKTNATLEAIAQALFKSWFVDFDPVRAKVEGRAPEGMDQTTATLFPDSFEETKLGMVPRGWQIAKLGEITERITKGTTPTTLKRQFVDSGVNFIKAESMTGDGGFIPEKFAYIDDDTHSLLKRSQLREGDVLISIAGTIGRIAVMSKFYLPANTNQAVALIRPRADVFPGGLINRFLRLSDSQQQMSEKVVQAVQANLSLGTLSDMSVVVPPACVVNRLYASGLAQLDASWLANDQRAQALASLRDTLLPRLTSGKLRLPEVTNVEEALTT